MSSNSDEEDNCTRGFRSKGLGLGLGLNVTPNIDRGNKFSLSHPIMGDDDED